MRGWTHFISGIAMASFFPELLADLKAGILLPVITGVYGYLPDFIDFKIRRFLWKRDYEIDPAPWDPKLKIAPRTIKVKDIKPDMQYQFYALEGEIVHYEDTGEEIILWLKDETGIIKVEAVLEDYERFKKIYGDLEVGTKIRITGYIDSDRGGYKLVFSDAPHPQYIASMIAKAIDEAFETGRMVTVKLHNIRMPGDVYRRYVVYYDTPARTIKVYMGPLVTTGGVPIKGTDVPGYRKIGEAQPKYHFVKTYPRPTVIDAFSGPEIGYRKTKLPDGREVVEEVFIPWHRGFSHSFTAGFLFALALLPFLFLINYPHIWQLFLASMLGYWMHVIEDQMGFMGNNLFPPLTKNRVPGLMLGPNIYTAINFATSWMMISLIIWNINRYTLPRPVPLPDHILLPILLIPTIIIYAYGVWDSIKFRRIHKAYWKYYATLEALEEEETIGGI